MPVISDITFIFDFISDMILQIHTFSKYLFKNLSNTNFLLPSELTCSGNIRLNLLVRPLLINFQFFWFRLQFILLTKQFYKNLIDCYKNSNVHMDHFHFT